MNTDDLVEQAGKGGFILPAYGSQKRDIIFLKSFWQPGMVEFYTTSVELKGDLRAEFVEALGSIEGKLTVYGGDATCGYLEIKKGCLEFKALKNTDKNGRLTTHITVSGILKPPSIPQFVDLVRNFEDRYRSASYWINIRECYWSDKRDEVQQILKGYPEHAFAGTLSELYTGVDVDKLLESFYASSENILLTLGKAGTGKTQLIKKAIYDLAILRKKDLDITYTKDVNALRSNSFWAELHSDESDMLILDDLDHELRPRNSKDADENNIVSRLLSFSNGVFPVQTKILITSNIAEQEVDSALIRPGRCLDVLELRAMPIEKAQRLWGEMTPNLVTFEEVFGDVETVTQAHFMSEVARTQSDLSRAYLTDPSISVRDSLIRSGRKNTMKFGS